MRKTPRVTYGDILAGTPDAARIMEILDVKPTTAFRRHRFKPNWIDRRAIDERRPDWDIVYERMGIEPQ